ncbi:MAG: RagB/SusD family nutrient uptake outer membrane protein [Saprospiraceae bacterium]|nr:RagB/SusD family nutrient uptake outer membrane protein [Saprospiraceae bacterium]
MKQLSQHILKSFAFLTILVIGFTGCEQELNKLPILGELESNFYQNEEDAIAAITAAYDPLQYNYTNSVYHFRWFFGDFASDDAIKGGSSVADQPQLEALSVFQGTANNIHTNADWTAKYIGIYRANLVIENVGSMTDDQIDPDLKSQLIAEAYFLRAHYYFELVTTFGGVPKVDKLLLPSEYNTARSSAEEIWSLIESDLTEAALQLPAKSGYNSSETGRATKGAALALLTKAHVYQGEWLEAQTNAELVVSSGEYSLDEDYRDIFVKSGENGPGSIFEIQRSPFGGGYWGSVNGANEGNLAVVYQLPRGQFGGWGFNLPTQNFVDEFEAGDPRLKSSVFMEGDTLGDRGVFTKAATGFDHDYYSKKYFVSRSEHEEINIGDPNMNGEPNDRLIRYADLLLMHAEAAYYNGQELVALTSLNLVRERARRNAEAGVLPDVTATGQALLDAILHERRVELGLEGHRFFDLVRQGRAIEVLGPLGFQSGTHELFPIPQQQIDLSSGVLTQNPGY